MMIAGTWFAQLIASTATANGGQYYFSSASTTALQPNTAYTIKVGDALGSGVLVGCTAYSPKNAAFAGNDADASGVISFTTGNPGQNDHTLDIGLTEASAICSLTATATPTVCNSATNQYTVSGDILLTNNLLGGTASVSMGTTTKLITVPAGATSVAYSLTGLTSDAASHTVTVSLTGCGTATATYSAPASCTVAPPVLVVAVETPVCNSVTNEYTATGTVSLSNATAGNLTITDNGSTIAVVSVTAGQISASFSVSGVSGSSPASHSVVASLNGLTASTTYATPASCTVCSLSLTTSVLANGQIGTTYSETLTTSGGTAPLSFIISSGSLPAGLTLSPTGVISGTPTAPAGTATFTIKVTDSKNCSAVAPLTITTSTLPVCDLMATATPGVCNSVNNTYMVTGTVSATNGPASQTLTVSVGG